MVQLKNNDSHAIVCLKNSEQTCFAMIAVLHLGCSVGAKLKNNDLHVVALFSLIGTVFMQSRKESNLFVKSF